MTIQKVYLKAIDSPTGEKTKSGAIKKIRTWHKEFELVARKRGTKKSKVGKGDAIEVDKTPLYIGDGVYAIADDGILTDQEKQTIMERNVKRLVQPRFNNALKSIDGLIAAIKNPQTKPNEDQAKVVMAHLMSKIQEVESEFHKAINGSGKRSGKERPVVTL